MSSSYGFSIFIGRFQPYHYSHEQIARLGLELSENLLFVLGSANQARSLQNPFTVAEREFMIRKCFQPKDNARIFFLGLEDCYNLDRWAKKLKNLVKSVVQKHSFCLVGYGKDSSTASYLSQLGWDLKIPLKAQPRNASTIRNIWLTQDPAAGNNWQETMDAELPSPVAQWMANFQNSADFTWLQQEYQCYLKSQICQDPGGYMLARLRREIEDRKWKNNDNVDEILRLADAIHSKLPKYPVQFLTADAVIVQNDLVLIGKRKQSPGRGLWALPGGHVETHETFFEAAIREADEETGIEKSILKDIGKGLASYWQASQNFDCPTRCLKGRVFTQGFLFVLPSGPQFSVAAADDLIEVSWMSRKEIRENQTQFFDDHFHILCQLLPDETT